MTRAALHKHPCHVTALVLRVLPEVEELWQEKYPDKGWLVWMCDADTAVNGTRLRCELVYHFN